jgi:hypothetical protein
MVFLIYGLFWGVNKCLNPGAISNVKICFRHYIWCLGPLQATTGSVPMLFGSGVALAEKQACRSHFQSLKKIAAKALKAGF